MDNKQGQLDELLLEWEKQRRRRNELTAEELCTENPELIPELSKMISQFTDMDCLEGYGEPGDDCMRSAESSTISGHADETCLSECKLSLDEFCQRLVASGLMDQEETEQLRETISADSARSFTFRLVAEKKLTRFQAAVLLEGRDIPLVLDRYVLLSEIGKGGMGAVYKALHQQMDRVVALKILPKESVNSPEKVKRFQREVKAAAKLTHQNIVVAFDACEDKGVHFLVMELVAGSDLSEVVRRQGSVSCADAVDYITQAARGLDHAHRLGIVHRDIKPGNLLLSEDGKIKILDLGLARIDGSDSEHANTVSTELTQAGMVMGTIAYLAPEQALDTRTADARSDIYSLGCSLYYLLTSNVIYNEDTPMKTIMAHREGAIPSLCDMRKEVPVELDAIFQKMVAKKQEDRFQSMVEVISALEQLDIKNEQSGEAILAGAQASQHAAISFDSSRECLEPTVNKSGKKRPTRGLWPVVAVCVLGVMGIAWAATIVLKVETTAGTIVLEIDQPELAGAEVSIDGRRMITIKTGEGTESLQVEADSRSHMLKVAKGGFEAFVTNFTVKGGGEQTIKVRLEPADEQVSKTTTDSSRTTWALEFDGLDDYVESPGSAYELRNPHTFELWLRANGGARKTETLISAFAPDKECLIGLKLDRTKDAWCFSVDESGIHKASECRFSIAQEQQPDLYQVRHHCALVWDGDEVRVYIDGRQQRSEAVRLPENEGQTTGHDLSAIVSPKMLIGAAIGHASSGQYFNGVIDEVRISNAARYTQDFIPEQRFVVDEDTLTLYHFDAGCGDSIIDSSGNGNHGTIHGAKWIRHPATTGDIQSQQNDRAIAEWVLLNGGWIATPDSKIEEVKSLPDNITLISVMLYDNENVSDEDLARLPVLEHLVVLALSRTRISDAGMRHVNRIRTLERLDLQGSRVTGQGLGQLASLPSLKTLWANGLEVSNADIETLARYRSLEQLSLDDPDITDEAVEYLKTMKSLQSLNLQGTRVTAEGKAVIEMAIPGCQVK